MKMTIVDYEPSTDPSLAVCEGILFFTIATPLRMLLRKCIVKNVGWNAVGLHPVTWDQLLGELDNRLGVRCETGPKKPVLWWPVWGRSVVVVPMEGLKLNEADVMDMSCLDLFVRSVKGELS